MNLTLIRWIDFYLGRPLCLLLSLILKIIPRRTMASAPRRILLIQLSEMGATLLAYSAIKRLGQAHPRAQLFFLTFKRNTESVELLRLIPSHQILTIRDASADAFCRDTLKVILRLRRLRFDIVYDLELFSRFSALLTGLSRAPRRAGFDNGTEEGLYRGRLLTHPVLYNTHLHMRLNFLALIETALAAPEPPPQFKQPVTDLPLEVPAFSFRPDTLAVYRKPLAPHKKTLVVNPHAGDLLPIRHWGIDRFARVIAVCLRELDMNVVLIGLANARDDARFILNHVGRHAALIDLIGKTKTVSDLIHVIQVGDVFLTNDSGPAHFATLTDTPSIVLFGPETPRLYAPISPNSQSIYHTFHCSPCLTAKNHRRTLCRDNQCLKHISPEEVIQRIQQMTTNPPTSPPKNLQ